MASSDSANKPSDVPTLYFAYGSNLSTTQMSARCPLSTLVGVGQLIDYTWLINDRGYANVVSCSRLSSTPPKTERNIVETRPSTSKLSFQDAPASTSQPTSVSAGQTVWGLLYALPHEDEARLDMAEGVPGCYGKEWLSVRFWPLDATDARAPSAAAALFKDVRDPFMAVQDGPAATDHVAEEARRAKLHNAPRSIDAPNKAIVPDGRSNVKAPPKEVKALVYVDRQRVTKGTIQPEYVMRMRRGCAEAEERGLPEDWLGEVIKPWLQ